MLLSSEPLSLGIAISRDTLEEVLFEMASQYLTILTCIILRLLSPEIEFSRKRSICIYDTISQVIFNSPHC